MKTKTTPYSDTTTLRIQGKYLADRNTLNEALKIRTNGVHYDRLTQVIALQEVQERLGTTDLDQIADYLKTALMAVETAKMQDEKNNQDLNIANQMLPKATERANVCVDLVPLTAVNSRKKFPSSVYLEL